MLEFYFYTFSKKNNSTKLPDTTPVKLTGTMIYPCNTLRPAITIGLGAASPTDWNYCYIPTYRRYYFVTSWTADKNLWTAELTVDVLATYKTAIADQHLYVLRSSAESDGTITDLKYPATSDEQVTSITASNPWKLNTNDGSYVVGTVGDGPAQYYSLLGVSLDRWLSHVFSDEYADLLMGADWSTAYPEFKTQVNPAQYITSIIYMPFAVTGTQVETIPVGWAKTPAAPGQGVAAFSIPISDRFTTSATFNVTGLRHPQWKQRGPYINCAPFSTYSLFFPPFGSIDIPPEVVAHTSAITAHVTVDTITGVGILRIMAGDSVITQVSAQVGTPVVIGDTAANAMSATTATVSGVGALGAAIMGNLPGALGSAVGALQNYGALKIPAINTVGSSGGMAALAGTPRLTARFLWAVDDDPEHYGRPLCQVRRLGALPGYLLISDADIDLPCSDSEREQIKNYLEGGFFLE